MNDGVSDFSPWPNRVARFLALVAFFLIFVGGLVTTTAAGMAVPDWPNTYGYNMFLYPFYDWFFGPWDLFVEHGHRLLGTLAGILAITLVMISFCCIPRSSLRLFSVALLMLVVFQGALGGVRVLLDDRLLANIHGCVGPLFLMLVVAFCVRTSRWYFQTVKLHAPTFPLSRAVRLRTLAQTLLAACYIQLILGSLLRHVPTTSSPRGFPHLVYSHLGLAGLIFFSSIVYWILSWRLKHTGLRWQVHGLVLGLVVQIGLGLVTWVMKYGFPGWLDQLEFAAAFVIPEKSMTQTLLVTAHMATGSAILCLWTLHVVRFRGLAGLETVATSDTMSRVTAAPQG